MRAESVPVASRRPGRDRHTFMLLASRNGFEYHFIHVSRLVFLNQKGDEIHEYS